MLKKPIVAAILCVIIVISSTVISTHARLDPQCEKIREQFLAAGGIAAQLEAVCDAGTGMANLATSYDLSDMESIEALDLCVAFRLAINNADPSSLANLYSMLKAKLSVVNAELRRAELSEKDAALLESYTAQLEAAQTAISSDPYNSEVMSFRKRLGAFSRGFARLCGVRLPEQFA